MEWTLGRLGSAAVVVVALCTACTFGQVAMHFNGSAASPAVYYPDDALEFHVYGPGGAPFAALISPEPRFEVTPYGLLLADPLSEQAVIFFDGFTPSHPTYGTAVIPLNGSPFVQTFVPFQFGNSYAAAYHVQALVADPSHPLGLRLTNHIELVYGAPPPTLISIDPNHATAFTAVTLTGTDFDSDPSLNVVRLNGLALQVLSATPTELFVMVPPGARSGMISVETPHGMTQHTPEAMSTWLAVAPALFCETTSVPSVVEGPMSIIGTLVWGQTQDFVVHLEAGHELLAEAYVFDLVKYCVTIQANSSTPYFDPILRVRRNPALPVTVLTDDDSGPSVTAAVGLPNVAPHYVASFAEDVVVQLDSQGGYSAGPYLLLLSTRPATGLAVSVQGITPTDARVGDVVTVLGTGFDPENPGQHTLILNGATAIPDLVMAGSLMFQIPAGARSGPVIVSTPAGQSPYDPDRAQSWLCVRAFAENYAVEGAPIVIPAAGAVRGAISPANDLDDFFIDLVAGQTLSLECHAVDPGSGSIISGAILALSPADLEIRIVSPGPTGSIVSYDQNSGPGLSAGIGLGPGNPPFTAPFTGTFMIRISTFFSWSQGEYLLAIGPGP